MPHQQPSTPEEHHPAGEKLTPAQIGQFGKKHVEGWLHISGYTMGAVNELPGMLEIEADHPTAKMLVHLKTALMPTAPKNFSPEEVQNLKARAVAGGRKPYAAKIRIDPAGRLVGGVQWQNLN